jgi:hypothetical protein
VPTADISFSPSEVLVIAGMLGVVIGALSWLFRLLLAEKENRRQDAIDREKAALKLLGELEPTIRRNTDSVADLLQLWREERRHWGEPR